jgi:hypothetical protein
MVLDIFAAGACAGAVAMGLISLITGRVTGECERCRRLRVYSRQEYDDPRLVIEEPAAR